MLQHLPDLPPAWHHEHLLETDTTMKRLKEPRYAEQPEEFVLLTADHQTAGRGQHGTAWEDAPGRNLLFGFLFHPTCIPADRQFALSEAVALAVRAALARYADGFTVKWPNDVYYKDQKVCGILLEHSLSGARIATTMTGIGVNVNQTVFRSDAPNPVSLRQIRGRDTDRGALLLHIIKEFEQRYRALQGGDYATLHAEYFRHLYRRAGLHAYRDDEGLFEAEITDISPLGRLTLQRADGTRRSYAFKEVAAVLTPEK